MIHTKILLLKSETRIANDDDIYKSKERVDLSNLNIKDYFDDKQFKFNLVIDNLNFTWLFKSQTIVKASVLSNFVFNKNFETFQNNLYILLFYSNITPLNDSDSTITEDERLYIWSKRKFIFNEYIIN
ncbi:hypothetical protein [Mycoplasma simbae]|uniref:hypothetical protein n=1 Tax=Mycoplasma simbae TaxID=36744 RepID=UPI0012EBECF6|nr:hypothetical protein [Mycoplasma simbae]